MGLREVFWIRTAGVFSSQSGRGVEGLFARAFVGVFGSVSGEAVQRWSSIFGQVKGLSVVKGIGGDIWSSRW